MRVRIHLLLLIAAIALFNANNAKAQMVKVNAPLILAGTPNVGFEFTVSQQMTINADVLWMPYMFKKTEEVFRSFQTSADLRYYVKPKYFYTNNMFDGFYVGPYIMYGDYNIGIKKKDDTKTSNRYQGWGLSTGVSLGYKFYLSRRLRLDVNLGLGYAHLQYDTYELGGEYADYPTSIKDTRSWVGPTKFGVHLGYNLFK